MFGLGGNPTNAGVVIISIVYGMLLVTDGQGV